MKLTQRLFEHSISARREPETSHDGQRWFRAVSIDRLGPVSNSIASLIESIMKE